MSQNESPTAGAEAPDKAKFIAKNNGRNSCPAFGWPRCAQILPRLHHTWAHHVPCVLLAEY